MANELEIYFGSDDDADSASVASHNSEDYASDCPSEDSKANNFDGPGA